MHEPGKNFGPSSREWDTNWSDADLDRLLAELKAPEDLCPRPGFYARVMDRIDTQRSKSIWSAFLEPLFGRRLAVASGILMLVLGAALFVPSSEFDEDFKIEGHPKMVSEEFTTPTVSGGSERDQDAVLVNLVTYQEH